MTRPTSCPDSSSPQSRDPLEFLIELDGPEQLRRLEALGDLDRDRRLRIEAALRLDESLRVAFEKLEELPAPPAPGRIEAILAATAREDSGERVLPRVRRPVNTMLWVTLLLLSTLGLTGLALLVYRLVQLHPGSP